jgi:sodium transport system ATP-binding protein
VIEVERIGKSFGAVRAVDGVSFKAEDGRITGLLGPNGAGKSTCLRILSTVLEPDTGTARIGGIDIHEQPLAARRLLGVLPHNSGLYQQLTGRENIEYYGRLHGLDEETLARRVDALIERLELGAIANRKAKGFSQGERTKVALARALVHDPQHLLLDEPTSGLDVIATRHLRDWLRELRAQGRCVLLSSHVMQEVEALVDDLVIIAAGRVTLTGSPQALAERFPGLSLEEIFVKAVSGVERSAG